MTAKDLIIDSPVYCVQLDKIDIARVCSIKASINGYRDFELRTSWGAKCVAKSEDVELHETNSSLNVWYVNIEDAKIAQLTKRSEIVDKLKKEMEDAQNRFADAIIRYAFSEPSTPKDL